MLEATHNQATDSPAISSSEAQTFASAPPSLQLQMGLIQLIREAALSLLNQLEPLSTERSLDWHENGATLHEEVRRFEVQLITNALFQTQGHQQKAARLLGIKATTLNSKIKRYGILPFWQRLPGAENTPGSEEKIDG